MSKKFNLKDYKKIDGDEHIDMRLEQDRKEAPDVLNEKQLESYRATESDITIEKLLENSRTGAETEITEKRLDTHKSKFANKYRNPDAYEGDMNKIEEQRLTGDAVEKEKYEAASKIPSQFKWWEDVKSPDGLKVASDTKKKVIARRPRNEFEEPVEKVEEMSFDKPRWQEAEEPIEEKNEQEPMAISDVPEDFDIIENKVGKPSKEINIIKEKYLPNKNPELSGIYMVLGFDPDAFKGDEEEIKQAALEKVLIVAPELSGLISSDNFSDIQEDINGGTVKLKMVGERLAPIVNKTPTNIAPSAIPMPTEETVEEQPIEEISYEEKDIEGTPMAIGRVIVNTSITPDNRDSVINNILDFVRSKHPHVQIEEDSLDLTDFERGEVRYMVGVMGEEMSNLAANSDFEIIVESAVSKKN